MRVRSLEETLGVIQSHCSVLSYRLWCRKQIARVKKRMERNREDIIAVVQ